MVYADFLWTNFNVFNNPSMFFFIHAVLMLSNSLKISEHVAVTTNCV